MLFAIPISPICISPNRYTNITYARHTIWNRTGKRIACWSILRTSGIYFNLDYHWILLATLNHRNTECRFIKSFSYCRWTKYFGLGLGHWALESIHTNKQIACHTKYGWIIEITRWINKSYSNRLCCYAVCQQSTVYTADNHQHLMFTHCILRTYKFHIYSSHSYPQIVWFNFVKYYSVCYCNRLRYWYSVSHLVFRIRCAFNFHTISRIFECQPCSQLSALNHRTVWFLA